MVKGFRPNYPFLAEVMALVFLLGIGRAAEFWRSIVFNPTAVAFVGCVKDSQPSTFVWSTVKEPCLSILRERQSLLSGFEPLAAHQKVFLAQLGRGLGDPRAAELLAQAPVNAFSRILAADLAFVAGDREQAQALYQQSCPTFLYRGRAEKALEADAWEEAEFYLSLFHNCALVAPDSYPVVYTSPAPDYAALAQHFLAEGEYPAAETWFRRAYKFSPNPGYLILSAVAQRGQNHTSEALSTLERALDASESNEQRYWALREIGQTHLAAGEFRQAQEAFSQALSITAKDEILFLLAEASYQAGEAQEACRYLDQAVQAESVEKVDQFKTRFQCRAGAH